MESAEMAADLAAGQQNRRAAPRQAVDEDASLLLVEPGCTLSCRLVDISLGGCRLRTKERFTAGSIVPVEITFKIRGLAFRFSGITRWTDGRHLVGIRFMDVSARRREDLVEALSEVDAENAAKAAQQVADKRAAEEQPTALAHDAAAKSVEKAAQRHLLILVPAPEMAAQQVAKKLDSEEGRGPQRRVLVAGVEDGGFNPRVEPTESPRALQAAEKGLDLIRTPEEQPSGPEGRADSAALTAVRAKALTYQSCPDTKRPFETRSTSFSAACLTPESAGLSHAEITPRERRVQAREAVDTMAVIFLINIASRLQGRILDLSLGGCRIRTDERFPVGIYTRVETEFRLEGLPFRLGGVVQAIHDRRTVGIRFLDMSSRKREQVAQLIEDIRQMKEQGIGNRE
jgi:c-di-GMP-binding flagellar brake protein YcgR